MRDHHTPHLDVLRDAIRAKLHLPDMAVLDQLMADHAPDAQTRAQANMRAEALVTQIRADGAPGLMEAFLAEYGLSTQEGVALMCLAEALLRVPDAPTIDALIEDKIAPAAWRAHLGRSSSSLVNASTWALLLTGEVLQDREGVAAVISGAVKRLGEPVIRRAVGRAIKELGTQFVLGETIEAALKRGRPREAQGYTFSYDMLGEAALTMQDADAYLAAYAGAIERLSRETRSDDIRENPGISIKLSALHPRYEMAQAARARTELVARTLILARAARAARIGLNIDAEEADRLDLSLDVIAAVLSDPTLAGWDGFGVVAQAYGKRAGPVIDWLYALAAGLDRKIMVRLVKGAYWDTEIKHAQVEGLAGFPVFSRKAATDVSYICCARKLLGMTDRIYPQFATHNAHTLSSILEMADDPSAYEFQRLHGMGEALHDKIVAGNTARCRIYAPVGAHRDLLAYLVRRLLENGANSSFVNQIVNTAIPPEQVVADPFDALGKDAREPRLPCDLYAPDRVNSRGYDLSDPVQLAQLDKARERFRTTAWEAAPLLAGTASGDETHPIINPADPADQVGVVTLADQADIAQALAAATPWQATAADRAAVLGRAADLFAQSHGEIFALLAREAGKTPRDAVAELREAVDFLRYYATCADQPAPARGVFACISPWNFPLAIFTGQVAAALAAGNAVIAKPAEATPLIATLAARLLHRAGVPLSALQLLPGEGSVVGAALTADPRITGVCFTGSTATARKIDHAMATCLAPTAPLIAETGGLNAMIVDSTALPEQAVRAIITSAFQSAGQRCSALRMLYIQKEVADTIMQMLLGAMDELTLGDPWHHATDIGPVIDATAQKDIQSHVDAARARGRVIKELSRPASGHFVAPAVIAVDGIAALQREIFGPVLHVATFEAKDLDQIADAINATGYGLTFGMQSRIEERVARMSARLRVGNIYINRNQIGAVVGSQPFGGEGLSGTGPKAGGPHYVPRFRQPPRRQSVPKPGHAVTRDAVARLIRTLPRPAPDGVREMIDLPGPTGETNRLSRVGRGVILCLGPDAASAHDQMEQARRNGCVPIGIAPGLTGDATCDGALDPDMLTRLDGIDGVICWADDAYLRTLRMALSRRAGRLIPLFAEDDLDQRLWVERHICIDTTAAGGNASLLAEMA